MTLAAFVLRVYGLHHQSFWLDEVDALAFAAQPAGAQLRKLTAIGENGPLYFLLLKGWLSFSGTSEFGARALSAMTSTVAVPLLGVLALRLFRHRPTALIAATLAATSPYYVWYAQDAKMYPLFAVLALGAQYAFLRAWGWGDSRPRRRRARSRAGARRVVGGVRPLLLPGPLRAPLRRPADRRQHGRRARPLAPLPARRRAGTQPSHRPRRPAGLRLGHPPPRPALPAPGRLAGPGAAARGRRRLPPLQPPGDRRRPPGAVHLAPPRAPPPAPPAAPGRRPALGPLALPPACRRAPPTRPPARRPAGQPDPLPPAGLAGACPWP